MPGAAGSFDGDMDAFQGVDGDVRIRALRRARDVALRRASRVICPSAYLREMAVAWGVPPERTLVVPNPAPDLPQLPTRDEARAALDVDGPTLAFAGRISRQKSLEVGMEAVSRVAGVRLLVAGEGPEQEEMERLAGERVRFLGPLPREDVLRLFRAADASLLSSTWENFPHTVVESLAVGTPVIATAVGGVPEVVKDGENGLLVPPATPARSRRPIDRFYGEPGLRERLAAAAAPSVAGYAVGGDARAHRGRARGGGAMRKLLMVGRTRYRLPLSDSLERKFSALRSALDVRVVASSADGSRGDDTFSLWRRLPVLDGAAFYGALPFRVARELRRFRPDAVTAQSPYEALAVLAGRGLARSRAALIVELHGDWRTFPRLYGSPLRRALAPVTDRVAPWALRRADAVRTISEYTTGLVRDVGSRAGRRLHRLHRPRAVRRDAARRAAGGAARALRRRARAVQERREPRRRLACSSPSGCPAATLRLIGDGHRRDVAERLVAEFPDRVSWTPAVPGDEIARALDDAWLLLLPSRAEGTPRIVLEAFCRGRAGRRRARRRRPRPRRGRRQRPARSTLTT